MLSESVASISEQKNGTGAAAGGGEGVSGKEGGMEKRLQPRAPLIHRPISMPLDRLLQGQLSICSPDKEQHDMGADTVIGGYSPLLLQSKKKINEEIMQVTNKIGPF